MANRRTRRDRMSLGEIEGRGAKAYTTKRVKIRVNKSGKRKKVRKHGGNR